MNEDFFFNEEAEGLRPDLIANTSTRLLPYILECNLHPNLIHTNFFKIS